MQAEACIKIFNQSIIDYHKTDNVDHRINNPYAENSIENKLYLKNWIDTVQWHLEDIVRDPEIDPNYGMEIKRRIDKSNQHRTDVVEQLDDYYMDLFKEVIPNTNARINTESPGWVVDRLSILCLKIYHMREEVQRPNVSDVHKTKCNDKLNILLEQEKDLTEAFNYLLSQFKNGERVIKVYRQMKMYNDEELNPVLYKNK